MTTEKGRYELEREDLAPGLSTIRLTPDAAPVPPDPAPAPDPAESVLIIHIPDIRRGSDLNNAAQDHKQALAERGHTGGWRFVCHPIPAGGRLRQLRDVGGTFLLQTCSCGTPVSLCGLPLVLATACPRDRLRLEPVSGCEECQPTTAETGEKK